MLRLHRFEKTLWRTLSVFAIAMSGIFSGCETTEFADLPKYHWVEKRHFMDLAFGLQHGADAPTLTRWERGARVGLVGSPSDADREAVVSLIEEFNELAGREVYRMADDQVDLEIHFISQLDFTSVAETAWKGRTAYFQLMTEPDFGIIRGLILVADQIKDPIRRKSAIRTMLARTTGLKSTSSRFAQSAFQPEYEETVSHLTEMDKTMIRLLYRREFFSGMNKEEVRSILDQLMRN